ncbi:Putative NAD(P)H nitroreductase YdjA [Paenibacillus plantiphilus]|uniref:Putative NAD(P)H nitroreductase n=1 Tax=Paenibacillus plantiphilus TaxID=2905650 RepID=A0ABN8G6U7_9BACL|nr:nitroreductase [Paenibacillus plantiphilus]CAH1197607.1 Putative NAD(P)H nitroreductase YdjA [Paenibacillus plantiphilus]
MGNTDRIKPAATIAALIKERRTVRVFRNDPVSDELLLELLNVAVWAPNHGLREPWRFILYKGEGRRVFTDAVIGAFTPDEKIKYAETRAEYYMGIPIHLIVILKEDPRQKQWDEDFAAVCCLIQNFQLAAWEQGLGVVWKTNPYLYDPGFRAATGVQPGEKVIGVLHVGYPDKIPPARPRTAAEKLLTVIDCDERR